MEKAKVHQWLGRCPFCYNCHTELDEVVALNMRLQFPDPGTNALAIRDVDEPKFHAYSRDFNIANSAWWAWRVIDWALNPRNANYPEAKAAMDRAYQAMQINIRDLDSYSHEEEQAANEKMAKELGF